MVSRICEVFNFRESVRKGRRCVLCDELIASDDACVSAAVDGSKGFSVSGVILTKAMSDSEDEDRRSRREARETESKDPAKETKEAGERKKKKRRKNKKEKPAEESRAEAPEEEYEEVPVEEEPEPPTPPPKPPVKKPPVKKPVPKPQVTQVKKDHLKEKPTEKGKGKGGKGKGKGKDWCQCHKGFQTDPETPHMQRQTCPGQRPPTRPPRWCLLNQ